MAYSSNHRSDLIQQMENLTTEYSNLKDILSLPPSYESLAQNTELINKVDQWEIDTIRQVKEIAEQIKEKIRHRSNIITTDRFGPEFQHLTERIHEYQRMNSYTESGIQQLTSELNDLKLQVEDTLLTTADIRITPIDWAKYLQLITKQQKLRRNQRNIRLDRLLTTRPRVSLDIKGAEWYTLGASSPINSSFLLYQHSKRNHHLSIIDVNGQQKSIAWFDDQSVWDSCWSSFLNKFIILADNELYTYDNEVNPSNSLQLIEQVKPKRDKMEFLRCVCSDQTLFITYDERNSSIDEYNISQWTLVNKHENIVKQNELITSISISEINPNLIGLICLDDKHHYHFELRDRTLLLISSIQLDKSEFNRRIISLPNSTIHWLIIHTGSKLFAIIDENGQTKRMIEAQENIDLASYMPEKNTLVVLTQKNKLKFFDL